MEGQIKSTNIFSAKFWTKWSLHIKRKRGGVGRLDFSKFARGGERGGEVGFRHVGLVVVFGIEHF
jgi:hypothetical protein